MRLASPIPTFGIWHRPCVSPAAAAHPQRRLSKVLLLEDHPDNRTIHMMALEHFGYSVQEVRGGEEALRRAGEHRPDHVLMQISNPVICRHTVTPALKDDPITASSPAVALAAKALAREEQRAREAECDGHLSKPIEPRRFMDEVRRHLARQANWNPGSREELK